MRMRRKPNRELRLERVSEYLIKAPEKLCGHWVPELPGRSGHGLSGLYVELGCGKGRFTCEMARLHPDILFIGIERVPDVVLLAMERAQSEQLQNVRFIMNDVRILPDVFAKGEISRLYVNFCDPWPGNRHVKRRLTSGEFLPLYRSALRESGEIHLKTDNAELFEYSLSQLETNGFELREVTRDLHGLETPLDAPNDGEKAIMTNYEEKFHAMGTRINRCVAVSTGAAALFGEAAVSGETPKTASSVSMAIEDVE